MTQFLFYPSVLNRSRIEMDDTGGRSVVFFYVIVLLFNVSAIQTVFAAQWIYFYIG